MNFSGYLEPIKREVLDWRSKILAQARARDLDGEFFLEVKTPALFTDCLLASETVTLCKGEFDINSLTMPFFTSHLWSELTAKSLPPTLEDLYPVMDPRWIGMQATAMKFSVSQWKDCSCIAYAPFFVPPRVDFLSTLHLLSREFGDPSLWKIEGGRFVLPLVLSGFDIFPDDDIDYNTHMDRNRGTLLPTYKEEAALLFENGCLRSVPGADKIFAEHAKTLTFLNKFLTIEVLMVEKTQQEVLWTKKDEKFYGRILSRILTHKEK
jgi:hypothetical protein